MAEVKLVALEKKFGDVSVIHRINLDIADGELAVLVGPSGCGKTTTLRMVAGLEEATGGSILFDGKAVERLEPKDRDIAMVFQSYALYPHMSVRDNMAFSLRMKGVSSSEKKRLVGIAAEMLGITDLLDRKPRQLSGGQRQRVAMGRALVREPKVFLFDEPLSNLDAALRAQMRIEIKRIHQRLRTTMIYVTHDQVEAMTLADKIVVMNRGHIEQVGDPLTLYRRPVSRFVAGFIGSPKMNFFPARLLAGEGGLHADLGEGIRIDMPRERDAAYRPYAGRSVEIGIRPEHLLDDARLIDAGAVTMDVTIDVVEPLGSTSLLTFVLGGTSYSAIGDVALMRRPGERVRLRAAAKDIYLINPESGRVVHPADDASTPVRLAV
jgi:multiple sugar transport system ATP-binding protein